MHHVQYSTAKSISETDVQRCTQRGNGKVTQMSRQKTPRRRTGYRRLLGLADKTALYIGEKNIFAGDLQQDGVVRCILVSEYPATKRKKDLLRRGPKAVSDVRSRASARKTGAAIWRRIYGADFWSCGFWSVCQRPYTRVFHSTRNSCWTS